MPRPSLLTFAKIAQHTYCTHELESLPEGWVILKECKLEVGALNHRDSSTAQQVATIFSYMIGSAKEEDIVDSEKEMKTRLIAYYHAKDNQIIIAFRGTDFSDAGDVAQDVDIALAALPSRVHDAVDFVNEIVDNIVHRQFWLDHGIHDRDHEQSPTFYFCGHSLGAALAEHCTHHTGIECVTFDSPGTLSHGSSDEMAHKDKITSILSFPNVINTANQHPGNIYFLPSELEDVNRTRVKVNAGKVFGLFAGKLLSDYIGFSEQTNSTLLHVGNHVAKASTTAIHASLSHSIDGFVDCLSKGVAPILTDTWFSIVDVHSHNPKSLVAHLYSEKADNNNDNNSNDDDCAYLEPQSNFTMK